MLQFIIVRSSLIAFSLTVAAMTIAISASGPAFSQQVKDTRINIKVCSANNVSGFTIDAPVSDSVVNTPNIKIEGSVTNISHIDVFIDNIYKDTIALEDGSTSYSYLIGLKEGTSTVRLRAYDMCGQGDHEKSIVVTYEKGVPPSRGSDVPTDVPGAGSSNPVSLGNPSTTAPKITNPPETSIPGLGLIPTPPTPSDIARGLDLDTSFGGEVKGLWRSAAVVAGFLMVAAVPAAVGHWIMPLVSRKLLNGSSNEDTVSKVSNKHHHHMIMRVFGLALIVVPFLV